MKISDLRKKLSLTQEEFAGRLGLASKGHVSEMEARNQCSVRVALEIERLSDGQISAASLNPDVGLVRTADSAEADAR